MSKTIDFQYSDDRITKVKKAEVLRIALEHDPIGGIEKLRLRCLGKEKRLLEVIKTHEDFKDDDKINQKLLKLLTNSKDLEDFRWGANLLLQLNPENINLRNEEGETLLHLAVTFADADLISRLVSEMSDEVVRAQNSRGESFLDYVLSGTRMSISRQEIKKVEDLRMTQNGQLRFLDLEINQETLQEKARQRKECFQAVSSAIFVKYKKIYQREHDLVRDFFATILESENPDIAIEEQFIGLKQRLTIAEDKPFLKDIFLVTNFLSNQFKTRFVRLALSINNSGDEVNLECLQVLLDCEFDLNFCFSDNPQTLLMRCARYKQSEAYNALYGKIAQEIIRQNILNSTGDVDIDKISGHVDKIFKQFVEGKYDILTAVLSDQSEIKTDEEFEVLMKTLFALGLPKQNVITRDGKNIFDLAFGVENYSFAAVLANNGASSDKAKPDQVKALFAAVKLVTETEGQEKTDALALLENILKCKIDPDTKSSPQSIFKGATPLLMAAQNQDLELAKLLVAYGADLDLRMEIKEEGGSVKETCVEECCKERGKESFFKKLKKVKKEKEGQEQGAVGGAAKEGSEPAPRPRGGAAAAEKDDAVSMRSGVSRVGLLTATKFASLFRRGGPGGGKGDC